MKTTRTLTAILIGPCCCDSRYDGCAHANPCRQPNDGTGRGPWCAECQPRRLDSIGASLRLIHHLAKTTGGTK